jgi:acyl-CoA thioester hydrolase
MKIVVPFGDVDMMNHVNNAKYFTYLETARTAYLYTHELRDNPTKMGIIIARAELDYKSPSKWRDELTIKMRTSSVGNSSWVYDYEIWNETANRLAATGKTVQVAYDYETRKPVPLPKEYREHLLQEVEETRES